MNDISIRVLNPGDVGELDKLLRLYIEAFGEPAYPDNTDYLVRLLNHDAVKFFVAYKGDKLVGGVTTHLLPSIYGDYNELYIYDMAVATQYRSQGIGSQILTYLKEYAKTIKVKDVYVQADTPDVEARNFYKKNGGIEEDVRHYNFEIS